MQVGRASTTLPRIPGCAVARFYVGMLQLQALAGLKASATKSTNARTRAADFCCAG